MAEYIIGSGRNVLNVNRVIDVDWRFECPFCKSKNIGITPVDMEFVYTNNPDTSNLPDEAVKLLKNVPNVVDAVIACVESVKGSKVLIECVDCHYCSNDFLNRSNGVLVNAYPDKNRLKKYLQKYYDLDDGINV